MSERHADWIRLFSETRASAHQTAQAERKRAAAKLKEAA